MHRRRKFKRAGATSNATLSLLGKELRDANLEDLIEGTSQINGLVGNPIDPLLATLVYNVPITNVINVSMPTFNVLENVMFKQTTPSLSEQSKPRYIIICLQMHMYLIYILNLVVAT